MSKLNWDKARRESLVRDRGGEPFEHIPHVRGKGKQHGITNGQAKELARLQRAAGWAYTGRGMTAEQAAAEIQRLRG